MNVKAFWFGRVRSGGDKNIFIVTIPKHIKELCALEIGDVLTLNIEGIAKKESKK